MKMCQRRHACGASRIRLRHPAILIIAARVLSGATMSHCPGDAFLPVTALAALKSCKITPATILNCSGRLYIKDCEFRCWEKKGHGDENLKKAMSLSCGPFFSRVGVMTGIDPLVEMAQRAGFGKSTGILAGETTGSLPTKEWRKTHLREAWSDPATATASIGQALISVTPMPNFLTSRNTAKVMKTCLRAPARKVRM